MKILDITAKLPWPLTDGARICMYHSARSLAQHGHDVHIVAVDQPGEVDHPLGEFATVHRFVSRDVSNVLGGLLTLFNPHPFTQWKRDLPQVYRFLDELHARESFDVVYVDEIHVAAYGAYMKRRHGLPYVLRTHNIEHEIYRRHTETIANRLMRYYLGLQTERWKAFELEQIALADAAIAITTRDEQSIREQVPGTDVVTLPAAVDLERFAFVDQHQREENSMVLLGDMKWPPNSDAAIWFAHEILPRVRSQVPDAVAYLIGADPPVEQLPPNSDAFRIEGRVPAIEPYYRRVTLGLIPLRVGGGMRVKMIEMMSSGMPVVSTGQGAEGNRATAGEHYLRADSAEQFADAIVRLLRDRTLRIKLSQAGRAFVEAEFSAVELGNRLERLLVEQIERRERHVQAK